jgi:hypothetical protein
LTGILRTLLLGAALVRALLLGGKVLPLPFHSVALARLGHGLSKKTVIDCRIGLGLARRLFGLGGRQG